MYKNVDWRVKNFLQSLVEADLLSVSVMKQASAVPNTLTAYLVKNNLLTAKVLAQQLAVYLQLPYYDLNQLAIDSVPLTLLDESLIRAYNILPLYIEKQSLYLAVTELAQLDNLQEIKFKVNLLVQPVIVEYDKFQCVINAILTQQHFQAAKQNTLSINAKQDESVVKFVQQVLADAIHKKASDLHFEPFKDFCRIRVRIDGLLHELMQIPLELAGKITARFKIMAKLDIAERRLPQDGRFDINDQNKTWDCRISTCPTLFAEKIVIRILNASKTVFNMDELGLEDEQKELFLQTVKLPQGMILVTGPTGSGKTASLYSALNCINTLEKNILTIEEPVEIQLAGINQVNVNSKIGLTFTTALRSLLRQDPDVIMLGEIRDYETAEIAIKAAQTGHLVLATLHTNSAMETLTRLINMGIAPFNIADSVKLIIAQRLVRKLCENCKQQQHFASDKLADFGFAANEIDDLQLYSAKGCEYCTRGYYGRIGVFEILPITKTLAQGIAVNMTTFVMETQIAKENYKNLHKSALTKVAKGITSLEEISRVIILN